MFDVFIHILFCFVGADNVDDLSITHEVCQETKI